MSNNPEFTNDEKKRKQLVNIVTMLFNRGWLDDKEKYIKKVTEQIQEDNNYLINNIIVRLISDKDITKNEQITGFLNKNKDKHKIVVVKSISKKQQETLINVNRNLEFFEGGFFMENLIDNKMVPQYKILTEEEAKDFKKSYLVFDNEMKRMLKTDAVARYYYLKEGQICKSFFMNEVSGISIDYRIVVS